MTNDPKASKGIDPDMLAAYIEKRLSPEQRAGVEAQLANDPDSHAVLVESMSALDAMARDEVPRVPEAPVVLVPKASPRRWVIAGGMLAAAAALLLVVRAGLIEPEDGISRLARVSSAQRATEGRLYDFPYAERPVGTRSGNMPPSDLALLSIAAEVRDRAVGNSAEALHERGVALLILGAHDDSIAALQAAATQSPDNEQYWSDLAAAFMERWRTSANEQDARDGADAARRAITVNPSSLPALFNLALAVEAVELRNVAAAAWERYLAVDASSRWAVEAQERLSKLRSEPSR